MESKDSRGAKGRPGGGAVAQGGGRSPPLATWLVHNAFLDSF